MTSFLSLSRKPVSISSLVWRESSVLEGVRFAVRRPSLEQRINFAKGVLELTAKNEFLKAGNLEDRLEAGLADLLVKRLYLEWGLAELTGLTIDGEDVTAELLGRKGPEALSDEIIAAIREETELSEDERKN